MGLQDHVGKITGWFRFAASVYSGQHWSHQANRVPDIDPFASLSSCNPRKGECGAHAIRYLDAKTNGVIATPPTMPA